MENNKKKISTLCSVSAATVVLGLGQLAGVPQAEARDFTSFSNLGSGAEVRASLLEEANLLQFAEAKGEEGKCGEEAKCGAKDGEEASCGDKDGDEGKCGEGKCGEGKCGGE